MTGYSETQRTTGFTVEYFSTKYTYSDTATGGEINLDNLPLTTCGEVVTPTPETPTPTPVDSYYEFTACDNGEIVIVNTSNISAPINTSERYVQISTSRYFVYNNTVTETTTGKTELSTLSPSSFDNNETGCPTPPTPTPTVVVTPTPTPTNTVFYYELEGCDNPANKITGYSETQRTTGFTVNYFSTKYTYSGTATNGSINLDDLPLTTCGEVATPTPTPAPTPTPTPTANPGGCTEFQSGEATTSSNVCQTFAFNTYYHNGNGSAPEVGNTVYSVAGCDSRNAVGAGYYREDINGGYYQTDVNGIVISVDDCI